MHLHSKRQKVSRLPLFPLPLITLVSSDCLLGYIETFEPSNKVVEETKSILAKDIDA